ncbi:hypothetical protein KAS50_08340 [bacterium]|nr:hypothetical protein [bacterium]
MSYPSKKQKKCSNNTPKCQGSEKNGDSITDRIDIFKQAGGSKRVLHKTYKLNISQGKLDIELKPVKGKALICGVVIEPVKE